MLIRQIRPSRSCAVCDSIMPCPSSQTCVQLHRAFQRLTLLADFIPALPSFTCLITQSLLSDVFLLYTYKCLILTLLHVPTQPSGTPAFHALKLCPRATQQELALFSLGLIVAAGGELNHFVVLTQPSGYIQPPSGLYHAPPGGELSVRRFIAKLVQRSSVVCDSIASCRSIQSCVQLRHEYSFSMSASLMFSTSLHRVHQSYRESSFLLCQLDILNVASPRSLAKMSLESRAAH